MKKRLAERELRDREMAKHHRDIEIVRKIGDLFFDQYMDVLRAIADAVPEATLDHLERGIGNAISRMHRQAEDQVIWMAKEKGQTPVLFKVGDPWGKAYTLAAQFRAVSPLLLKEMMTSTPVGAREWAAGEAERLQEVQRLIDGPG